MLSLGQAAPETPTQHCSASFSSLARTLASLGLLVATLGLFGCSTQSTQRAALEYRAMVLDPVTTPSMAWEPLPTRSSRSATASVPIE